MGGLRRAGREEGAGASRQLPSLNTGSDIAPDRHCLPEPASSRDPASAFLLAISLAFKALQKPPLKCCTFQAYLLPPPYTESYPHQWVCFCDLPLSPLSHC